MAVHNDPKLLYAINGINAYHIEHGKEECLTPSGPQTLSLLMVPTAPSYEQAATPESSAAPEEDFYLHLHLPPELDLPLPATTQIYFQPPSSYLIPRAWDLGPDRGAFTRIEFPGKTRGGSQEDIDTFETIIAQCTAFLERAPPPRPPRPSGKTRSKSSKSLEDEPIPAYDPSAFKPGEGYVRGSSSSTKGQIVLVDEENGSVVGELGDEFHVVEDSTMKHGSKEPVVITLPEDGSGAVGVAPASARHLDKSIPEAYRNSALVNKAAWASRLIITGSDYVSKSLTNQAEHFAQTTKPNQKPMTFTPTTHDRIRKVHTFSSGAVDMSSKVVGHVSKYAQNIGATLLKHSESKRGDGAREPGLLNKSMMAFTTIADGVEYAGKSLTNSSTSAATRVITHRYGDEAGELSKSVGGNIRNVALVYIDVTGVSRKAIVKSVAKGMVVGKVGKGDAAGHLVVPGTEDTTPASSSDSTSSSNPSSSSLPGPGVIPTVGRVPSALDKPKQPPRPRPQKQQQDPMNWKEKEAAEGRYTESDPYMSGGRGSPTSSDVPPPPPRPLPTYGSGAGEVLDETPYQGDSKERWG